MDDRGIHGKHLRTEPLFPGVPDVRERALLRVASLCRGDWSGHIFDGRDVASWIYGALYASDEGVTQLNAHLIAIDDEYQKGEVSNATKECNDPSNP